MTMFDFDRQMSMEASHKVGMDSLCPTPGWTAGVHLSPVSSQYGS